MRIPRWIIIVCRLVFGATFIFSGFVKAIDPLGFSYKMQDYLEVWNLSQFDNLTLLGAVCMSALEFLIGCCVISGIRLRESVWVGLAFMLFYTPLTLWIAITNPVSDCGCFGDALVITNWQTFWKNFVLLALIIVVLLGLKQHNEPMSALPSWLTVSVFFAVSVALSCYCLEYLPIIDFRPYKIGANITEGMQFPDDADKDVYETTFIYEKNGVEQKFTLDNYPWQDSTWHFVDQTSVLVHKGYTPPIHDFVLTTLEGDDITDLILNDSALTYLVVMYDLAKTDECHIDELRQLVAHLSKKGISCYALTSSYSDIIEQFEQRHALGCTYLTADPIMLKTVVRANPGIVVLQHGTVIDKYHHNRIEEKLAQL